MVNPIPSGVRKFWEDWKIRGAVLVSLFIQIVLVLVAPFRKRTGHKLVILIIWSGYLLADGVAIFALGQISNVKQDTGTDSKCSVTNKQENGFFSDLAVFWSTFLLVHLGGPDTITAFALADTELWIRQLFSLVIQAAATVYLILLTLPCNKVIVPTILLFVAGVIKYTERCVSLYLSNARAISQCESVSRRLEIAVRGIYSNARMMLEQKDFLDELQIVKKGYDLIRSLKSVTRLLHVIKNSDFEIPIEDTMWKAEVAMNFLYESIYTKAVVVHCRWGYILRFLTLTSIVAAVSIFRFEVHNKVQLGYYKGIDVGVTYALLIGAIILELYSLVMAFFSDWTVGKLDLKRYRLSFLTPIFRKLINLKKTKWDDNLRDRQHDNNHHYHSMSTGILFRRWSGCVSRCSLTRYCFKVHKSADQTELNTNIHAIGRVIIKPFCKVFCFLRDKLFKEVYEEIKYVSHEPLTKELWEFIYSEVHKTMDQPKPSNFSIHSSGGQLALMSEVSDPNMKRLIEDPRIQSLIDDRSFGKSLVIWHIATEMLYYYKRDEDESAHENINEKEFSKILSDHMLYLLITRQTWPLPGELHASYDKTCEQLKEFLAGHRDEIEAYTRRMHDSIVTYHGGQVFGWYEDSVNLARSLLLNFGDRDRREMWRVVGSVWVEKLLFGAMQCSATTHADHLCAGAELLTLVWISPRIYN